MSHVRMNRVPHMYESCPTSEWAMPHICTSHIPHVNESCHTYEWVMSHIWMSHYPHMNTSYHTYEWVIPHVWMRHVAHMNESRHTYTPRVRSRADALGGTLGREDWCARAPAWAWHAWWVLIRATQCLHIHLLYVMSTAFICDLKIFLICYHIFYTCRHLFFICVMSSISSHAMSAHVFVIHYEHIFDMWSENFLCMLSCIPYMSSFILHLCDGFWFASRDVWACILNMSSCANIFFICYHMNIFLILHYWAYILNMSSCENIFFTC